MLSAPERFWKATPATLSPIIAGPPLFPGLIAASICIAISWEAPWTYCVGSTLETTPLVTEMLSPPAQRKRNLRRGSKYSKEDPTTTFNLFFPYPEVIRKAESYQAKVENQTMVHHPYQFDYHTLWVSNNSYCFL